jgi:hypothetical protein
MVDTIIDSYLEDITKCWWKKEVGPSRKKQVTGHVALNGSLVNSLFYLASWLQ